MKRPDAKRILVCGKSGSGKSSYIKALIEFHSRVIVFDPKNEYGKLGFKVFFDRKEFFEASLSKQNIKKDSLKICFVPANMDDFNFFCAIAMNFNRAKESLIICEELASFCNTGKLTKHSATLINQVRAFGGVLVLTAQRCQEIAKSIVANVNIVNIHNSAFENDRKYLSNSLGIDINAIPRENMQGIQVVDNNISIAYSCKYVDNKPVFFNKKNPLFVDKQGFIIRKG